MAKARIWNESRVRRAKNGRFTFKPKSDYQEEVDLLGQPVKRLVNRRKLQERLRMYRNFSEEQRGRFRGLPDVTTKKPEDITKVAKPAVTTEQPGDITKPKQPKGKTKKPKKDKPKQPRTPTAYPPPKDKHVRFEDGRMKIWRDTEYAKFDPSFKVRTDKNFKYEITLEDGTVLNLNNHPKVIEFKGEVVMGVPSLTPRLREMTPKSLVKHLAEYMQYVEAPKSAKVPSPQWLVRYMGGEVPKQYLYKDAKGHNYLKIEIHHLWQWARIDFLNLKRRFDAGEITWEQVKEEARKALFKERKRDKKTGRIKEEWKIIPLARKDRKYVLLAGGVHRCGSPLYLYHHPLVPDIDSPTPKWDRYGIPDRGRAGREWYNQNFRPYFWREVYKREAYIIHNEINRRIKKGELSLEDVQSLWSETREGLDREYQRRLSLKQNKKGA